MLSRELISRSGFSAVVFLFLLSLELLVLSAGCGPRKIYAPTPEGEFEASYDAYQKKKYATAIESFKQLIYKYPGSDLVEQSRYYLGDSYFQNGEYLLAANEFERLNREFPQGKYADEALFKAGLAYSDMKRRPERDQAETLKALELLETLLAKYPNTKYADTVAVFSRNLKDQLAEKELMAGLFYFKRKLYESAIIYLKGVLDNYPKSSSAPSALYHLYLASERMGYPDDARDARAWLCREYANTEYGEKLCKSFADSLADSTAVKKEPAKTSF